MPVRDMDKITDAIALKSIAGFLVDTCVYEGKRFSFGNGILQQLVTLKDHDLKLFYTDVIYNEILNHLESTLAEQRRAFEKAIGALGGGWAVSKDTRLEITGRIFGPGSVQKYCKQVLDDFFAAADAEEIQCHGMVEVQDILDLYHEKKPPFSDRKKHEFPDAFTLLAIDRWAFYNDKQVVVVSSDGDVENFCKTSQWLICVKDLSDAMSAIHRDKSIVDVIHRKFLSGELQMQEDFELELQVAAFLCDTKVTAHSWADYQIETTELVASPKVPLNDILKSAILIEHNLFTVALELRVPCVFRAQLDISFEKWDEEDEMSFFLGVGRYEGSSEVDLIMTATFYLNGGSVDFGIFQTQIDTIKINLGEIGPEDSFLSSELD